MHPLFNQQLALQHMQDLQRGVEAARSAAHLNEAKSTRSYHSLLQLWHSRARFLSRPSVVQEEHPEVVNYEEIKPALVSTFSTMHETGLVSEYDDRFVEKFVQAFERELAHQGAGKCS